MFFIIEFFLIIKYCLGASSGNVGQCNAFYDNFGCETWGLNEDGTENRMDCIDQQGGIMDWVAKPLRSDYYTLRSGNNLNENDLMKIKKIKTEKLPT